MKKIIILKTYNKKILKSKLKIFLILLNNNINRMLLFIILLLILIF
jgi:hypothetical protein